MNIKEKPMRRNYLLKQCARLNCTIEDILRYHPDILTHGLRSQCLLMYYQEHKRYFRIDEIQEKV